MRSLRWLSAAVLAIAIVAAARFLLQRQESAALRSEIALLEHENRQLASLRTERDRLLTQKIPGAELERLRNDRAALARLRAEINKLEESAERKARALQEPVVERVPALVLNFGLASDGGLLLDGVPADQNAVRQLLTGFAQRSERVEIRLRVDPTENRMELLKTTFESLGRLGKELGLKMTLRFDKSASDGRAGKTDGVNH